MLKSKDPLCYIGKKFRNGKSSYRILSIHCTHESCLAEYLLQDIVTGETKKQCAKIIADNIVAGIFELLKD